MPVDDRIQRELRARRRVLQGDRDAWADLIRPVFRGLHSYVLVRAERDPERTEDVVQESWMVAVRRIRYFDPRKAGFEAWVRGIANKVLQERRRSWARQAASQEDPKLALQATPPADHSHPLADAEVLELAMTALPSRYQRVLCERYRQDSPLGEIAARLGVSTKAAESLVARARAALREALERLDPDRGSAKP